MKTTYITLISISIILFFIFLVAFFHPKIKIGTF